MYVTVNVMTLQVHGCAYRLGMRSLHSNFTIILRESLQTFVALPSFSHTQWHRAGWACVRPIYIICLPKNLACLMNEIRKIDILY